MVSRHTVLIFLGTFGFTRAAVVDPLSLRTLESAAVGCEINCAAATRNHAAHPNGVFGLRMLNNVKIQYAQAQNWFEVLDILECQLMVETVDQSAQAALQFERGECRCRWNSRREHNRRI